MNKATQRLSIIRERVIGKRASDTSIIILNNVSMVKIDQTTDLSRDVTALLFFKETIDNASRGSKLFF